MTYIHWMKRNGTERNHVELHYDHHQDCIMLGCKSSAFISSNIIWLSVYVCECTMYKLERKSMRTKKENLLVLLPYLSYFSLLFLAFVNDVRLSFNSFFCTLYVICLCWPLDPVACALLRFIFLFYRWCCRSWKEDDVQKTHAHILSLYIWSMSVFMFRLNCSTFKLNSRNEWGNSKSGKCW